MNNKSLKFIKEWVMPLLLAVIIAFCINKFLIFKVHIPSGSMIPTLNKGDHLFVSKIYNLENITRGDIIVFKSTELKETLIKRLIGLPGDDVAITNGIVTVNGEVLNEDYVKNNDFNYNKNFKVPEGKYFFLGDNRSNSKDSRYWINPYIDGDDIMAKARIRIYPFGDFGTLK